MLADFKIGTSELSILNIQLPNIECNSVEQTLKEAVAEDDLLLLVLGDFSSISSSIEGEQRELGGMQAVLPLTINTSCGMVNTNNNYRFTDNILASTGILNQLTGVWGVVRQGLTHLAIPCGWDWGGPASPHCPVWAEIYVTSSNSTAL